MRTNRRKLIGAALAGGLAAGWTGCRDRSEGQKPGSVTQTPDYARLDEILKQPVLKKELFPTPIIIENLELLRYRGSFLCRVRSYGGAEGISVGHSGLNSLYPIFNNLLQPFFIDKDARDLDMLGRIANRPIGQLIGDLHHPRVAVYQATEYREKPVDESLELIKRDVAEYDAQALKIKVGGLMFMTKDINAVGPKGRTETIIPLIRKTFGDKMALYADANGFYSVDEAIRVGRLLEECGYGFFEEPVPFDWYEETKQVADALTIPIAGGEQEYSLHGFRWLIANDGLQIVQPDNYYFGGMIRSMKVARMAQAFGKTCTPHMSSGGLGFLYMIHFVSALPNACAHHEFKGLETNVRFECKTTSLSVVDGKIKVPTGAGLGVDIDPDFIEKHEVVKD
jgi:L-alanine-DL-glutamate epimerase-like enolase superfamily enzyme